MKKLLFVLSVLSIFILDLSGQTFNASVNEIIPDDGTVAYYPIEVSGLPNALNSASGLVQVCLNLDHTYDSDLDVKLISPEGIITTLFSGVGGGGQNFTNCCLRYDAADYIFNQSAPFTGTFLPTGDFSALNNGQNPNGIWQLRVYDTYAFADQGYMYDWSITFESGAPEFSYPFESTNLPIIKLFSGGQSIPNEPKVQVAMKIINHGLGQLNYVTETNYQYEGDILVELQGFTGPYYPKVNYDFDLIDSTGNEIDTTLLGLPAENDFILKAEYLDPTLMYNNIAYSFGRKMDRYAPRLAYCELFIDEQYLGVFSLTEKIKRSNERVDISKLTPADTLGDELTGGYIIEMNINGAPGAWNSNYLPINYNTCNLPVEFKYVYPRADNIQPAQATYIKNFVDIFEGIMHQTNFDDPETGYRSVIAVPSFIDFMLVNEMSTNYDSYGRSTFMYKEKITDGNKLHIGPPWDYDRGFAAVEGWVWEITHPGWPFPDWWSILNSDSTYRHQVWCRWQELRADKWSDEAFVAHIDSLQDYLSVAAISNYERWPELGVTDWNQNVANLTELVLARLAWMDANINESGNCFENIQNTSVNNENFEAATFPPNCWTIIDNDQNNQTWNGSQPVSGMDGGLSTFSYNLDADGEDNLLITPQLTPLDGENISWYASTIDNSDEETYQLLLSTSGNDAADFTTVLFEENLSGSEWQYRAIDLSSWWGQNIYLVFRHITNQSHLMLKLDNIQYPSWTNPAADCTSNVDEQFLSEHVIFPNPASESFFIQSNSVKGKTEIKILDASGKCLSNFQMNSLQKIEIPTPAAGVYTIQIKSENRQVENHLLMVR